MPEFSYEIESAGDSFVAVIRDQGQEIARLLDLTDEATAHTVALNHIEELVKAFVLATLGL
jgi:hypothetical protein